MSFNNQGAQFSSILAVIRGYDNSDVLTRILQLIEMGITVVFVGPPCQKSERWIREANLHESPSLIRVIIPDYQRHAGRSYDLWSEGLNAAIPTLIQGNFKYLLTISGEALVEVRHIQKMLEHFILNPNTGVVGSTFTALMGGSEVALGASYSNRVRNTFGMWSSHLFRMGGVLEGGFDTRCNALGGMEDYHAAMLVLHGSTYDVTTLNLKVPVVVGIHHDQEAKEIRENLAMQKINAMFANDLAGARTTDRVMRFAYAG